MLLHLTGRTPLDRRIDRLAFSVSNTYFRTLAVKSRSRPSKENDAIDSAHCHARGARRGYSPADASSPPVRARRSARAVVHGAAGVSVRVRAGQCAKRRVPVAAARSAGEQCAEDGSGAGVDINGTGAGDRQLAALEVVERAGGG